MPHSDSRCFCFLVFLWFLVFLFLLFFTWLGHFHVSFCCWNSGQENKPAYARNFDSVKSRKACNFITVTWHPVTAILRSSIIDRALWWVRASFVHVACVAILCSWHPSEIPFSFPLPFSWHLFLLALAISSLPSYCSSPIMFIWWCYPGTLTLEKTHTHIHTCACLW